ncbi:MULTISPECIES: 3-methyl-2-oxobutanoate hydroxymethyltransferase [Planococcus]|uniref:3-methyl-2-oxobutanoate hydroxymethyltransferase n=1 Tax=Planococcus faecalis TaxID=1598147 RepID=A0ABN4XSY1_9BACL|nr:MULTISPECIES: 3-methyl-2-oxobutanoate hydroxymethyltransferase [Planococcus]AQU80815.1 3-methyl-2-oxobutanoate hydroxymethyltransferase [Planococcus faecalis]MDJ0332271.1 3-methyl-2-oxobutanoate hydroxymethyltransferase [Planococcus sp. S3-L1]OHX55800.1 3-methyl-2-oxobutanoate hydroxymethyltransferase [Planococcus faecalis]
MKNTASLIKMKTQNEKIAMLTAYDYPSAKLAEEAGIDVILVGDSLGMVVLGYDSTVKVTVDDMIHHGKAARRGAPDTFLVVDMPFASFHGSAQRILDNAVQIFQETGAEAVKVEGADEVVDAIQLLTRAGIPVVAHLGLLPQSAGVLGGYKVQGKTADAAQKLIEDAQACEAAGACMLVLECIPYQLADKVTTALTIPVIGIGAGSETDGQVLVYHDTLKYGSHHLPKFVRSYAETGEIMKNGLIQYVNEVKSNTFPAEEHRFTMREEELHQLYGGKE